MGQGTGGRAGRGCGDRGGDGGGRSGGGAGGLADWRGCGTGGRRPTRAAGRGQGGWLDGCAILQAGAGEGATRDSARMAGRVVRAKGVEAGAGGGAGRTTRGALECRRSRRELTQIVYILWGQVAMGDGYRRANGPRVREAGVNGVAGCAWDGGWRWIPAEDAGMTEAKKARSLTRQAQGRLPEPSSDDRAGPRQACSGLPHVFTLSGQCVQFGRRSVQILAECVQLAARGVQFSAECVQPGARGVQ